MAGSKPFLDVSKSFLFVKCSFLMVLLFVIVVAVMGHRRFVLSTNITRSNYFVNLQRLLTKIKNNNRPKIKP